MDKTDLQEMIEVIAARLREAEGQQPGTAVIPQAGAADSVKLTSARAVLPTAELRAAGDAARVIAEVLAARPSLPGSAELLTAASGRGSSAVEADGGGPMARIADSLAGGLGLVSLVKGLFTSDNSSAAAVPALPKFSLPQAVRQDIAYSSRAGAFQEFDRAESGGLRGREAYAPPAITVNVQAMDSKSFLDHSHDIARAVREAMLNSNSLNDVVSEL
jgi:hypothetical protein